MIQPIYQFAKKLIPKFNISQQNLYYLASLIHYYSITKLKRFKTHHQSYLYLLCYLWQRYQQFVDNLVEAFSYHQRDFDEGSKNLAREQFRIYYEEQQKKLASAGRVLKFYVDETIPDEIGFGEVRKQAFSILPKEQLALTAAELIEKQAAPLSFRWQAIDKKVSGIKKYLRPLFLTLDMRSNIPNYKWMMAIRQLKKYFLNPDILKNKEVQDIFLSTIPKQLYPYLLTPNDKESCINMGRYEFWLYRRLKHIFASGQIYLDDSFNYRCFDNELVPLNKVAKLKQSLQLPILKQPIKNTLKEMCREVKELWIEFNQKLKDGKLSVLEYDSKTKEILWHKTKKDKEEEEAEELSFQFYSRLPRFDIADVLRFVNKKCNFLSALTPLQPYYVKNAPDEDGLIAAFLAQSLSHGNQKMSEISDLSYDSLNNLKHQYLYANNIKAANDPISNSTKEQEIFPYYSLDMALIVASVDGQKYSVSHPTIKARHSSKYFGRGKGVVAYTLLANNIPLQSMTIGAHDHESYYMLDILAHNTTNIIPSIVTGDMHSKNKANFFALYCFNYDYYLRFSNVKDQLKNIYCCDDLNNYKDFLVKPAGKIDLDLIEEQWSPYIERVIVTLAQKETTQHIIMKKLCHHQQNRTLKAIYEFDKLISTRYILKCLLDPKIQQLAHRSQNCIESYHQLRAAVAQAHGKKELIGRNDLDVDLSNQTGRLVANGIINFNSIILSMLIIKYRREGRLDLVEKIKKISPIAWQHIHFLGHYFFRSNKHPIDLETLINSPELFNVSSIEKMEELF
jgi:TnpA family transposase